MSSFVNLFQMDWSYLSSDYFIITTSVVLVVSAFAMTRGDI